jgi:hypothetical protein
MNCASGALSCLYLSAGEPGSPDLVEYPTDEGSPANWGCYVPQGSTNCSVVATGDYFDAAH